MPTLGRDLRRELERAVTKARRAAEAGARKVLEQLAVPHHEPWPHMTPDQRRLRNRLRAHGRQLGDHLDERRGTQAVDRLVGECAYEHWHRMLFARFLAESGLLIEPRTGVAISLDECRELARDQGTDWLSLASTFAVRMLPQIFRAGDPALDVGLPPETRQALEKLLEDLPSSVFTAEDSLGWVYQFWQTDRKDEVNKSGIKIGADELAPVTQLFTEDYMVLFLLHNTLGAWWTAKRRSEGKDPNLPGYEWTYLRFKEDGTPAAGRFDGWPRMAKDITVLDPCMGSGHFLVFALPILLGFRMEEEGLSREEAVDAVLRDNIFGLELDPRCTQIAAFNLALTVWRMVGYRTLPPLKLACSGLGINAKEEDWVRLAGEDERLRGAMRALYRLFQQAPVLGSLIDPKRVGGDLLAAEFEQVQPVLETALGAETGDEARNELAVTAKGLVQAARILASGFSLVATNVPYLGRPDQSEELKAYLDVYHRDSRADLATCLLDRCLLMSGSNNSVAVVSPRSWLFQPRYRAFRKHLLRDVSWNLLATLGPGAFEMITGKRVNVSLSVLSRSKPSSAQVFSAVDVSDEPTAHAKRPGLMTGDLLQLPQASQLDNPDSRIIANPPICAALLSSHARCVQGLATADDPQFTLFFWELHALINGWQYLMGTVEKSIYYGGRERIIHWQDGSGRYFQHAQALKAEGRLGGWKSGTEARGKVGILVSQMSTMPVTIYTGEFYDHNASVLVPKHDSLLPALWAYVESPQYGEHVRKLDASLKPSNSVFAKVPFDLDHWQRVAAQQYPDGLPKPQSVDPTQWLFSGAPRGASHALHVAVPRLLGYVWPGQAGAGVRDCAALNSDGLERHADADGIVCLNSLKGEAPAVDRLRGLLAEELGTQWTSAKETELLSLVRVPGKTQEEWLRDAFFEQHCRLFHDRPFIWHVWDGLANGFHALVNYHKLAAPDGEGRRTLEKLIYSYLGDWIDHQRADQKHGVEGADGRVAAAEHLKAQLEKILEGEPPFDIFVRWKPLHEQPIGWEPDINDGVRINIRPFMLARPLNARGKSACILRTSPRIKWEKDRGKEPQRPREEFPWFWGWDQKSQDFGGGTSFDGNRWNNLHFTSAAKRAARERRGSQGRRA